MIGAPSEPEAVRDLAYYEAVPYLLVIESVEDGGRWLRRATYPELPGCVAEAHSAPEAMEQLERERRRLLRRLWDDGTPIPVPRPPLRRVARAPGGDVPDSGNELHESH